MIHCPRETRPRESLKQSLLNHSAADSAAETKSISSMRATHSPNQSTISECNFQSTLGRSSKRRDFVTLLGPRKL